ncbi:MAG: M3 family oligoendopeptidase [Hyphomicrobiales bacterium]
MQNSFEAGNNTAAAKESSGSALDSLPEWDLSDLYPAPDSNDVAADYERAENDAKAFADNYQGNLAGLALENPSGLADAIKDYENLQDLLGRLASYATLHYTGNTTDPGRVKFYGDMQETLTRISTQLLFFGLELNRIEDNVLDAAMANAELAHYKPWLLDLRKERPFQLDDQIEQLFHEKSITGWSAFNRLFDETIASLRFDVDGEELTIEPTLNMLVSQNAAAREEAGHAISRTLGENMRTFALITNTLSKDKEISDRWRGFEDIADSRHLSNRVEREVVEALVSSVEDAYPRLSHRYYKLKAKWLGMDKLNFWDRNAPLPEADDSIIGWENARKIVLDAYSGFAPEMADIARNFFDKNWIDATVREGKSTGAFAHPTVPSAHPYVLLNYQGKSRDVMTLAHELGHGVHQVLAAGQGPLMAGTPLTLAETASVFGEMLTFRSLLDGASDEDKRKALLAGKVEDMLNTVVRQIAFYSFERKVHTARREGELTADQICDLWMSVQGESLGPAIRLNEGYETYWSYIPHFIHSPFYVYAYAFGDCLVNSLYSVYQNSEAGFAEKYFDMLRAGGSKHHSELLAPFGLDASDPAFWAMGLKMIEGLIDELEQLDA